MPAIVNSGAAYIAAKVAAAEPVLITDFVLATIGGLDHTGPVDLAEVLPDPGDIVYTALATQSGYLNMDKVVYSLAMDTSIGDFTFNWIGLTAEDGTLVAVAYVPPILKQKTSGGVQGNNVTRNFLLQFADAQTTTGITVPADTWQIDVTAYLQAMDERERDSNRDLYGPSSFFGSGWRVDRNGGGYRLQPGIGYVAGIRIVATADIAVNPGVLPTVISLDVSLQKAVDKVVAVATPTVGTVADYVDASGRSHYGVTVATIDTGGAVTDVRRPYTVTDDGVLAYLLDRIGEQVPQSQGATTVQPGIAELATSTETQTGTDATRVITPKALADNTVNALTHDSTRRPLSAAQGKALKGQLDTKLPANQTATTTRAGIAELATTTETRTGTDTARVVTPKALADNTVNALNSTSSQRPLSAAQGKALKDALDTKLPANRAASTSQAGIVERATASEVLNKTDATRYVSPATLWAALNVLVPIGVVVIWSGSVASIPTGWALCDGAAGRPNMIDRFIVCAGSEYNPGNTGGATGKNTSSAGAHAHSAATASAGGHNHTASTNSTGSHGHSASTGIAGSHNHTVAVGNHTLSVSRTPSHKHVSGMPWIDGYYGLKSLSSRGRATGGGSTYQSPYTQNQGGGGAHNHAASTNTTGGHVHGVSVGAGGSHSHTVSVNSGGAHTHGVTVNSGGGHTHSVDVRPKYFAAAYIVRVA